MGGTNIFKVLADGQRREILMMLKDGRLNAGEISEKLQITLHFVSKCFFTWTDHFPL